MQNKGEMGKRLAALGRVMITNGGVPGEQINVGLTEQRVTVSRAVSRLISRIPRMSIRETVNAWRNAIKILADEGRSATHADARELVRAINAEWIRRRGGPFDPEEYFSWPSTEADEGKGGLVTSDWEKVGALQYMGYKVGHNGESQRIRERILAELFAGPIPPVFPDSYIDQWGDPCSPARLRKMAESIASFTRNAKRKRTSGMHSAIREWEQDLEFLYMEYYVGKFHFAWPDSNV